MPTFRRSWRYYRAASRRLERSAQRHRRELLKQQKEMEKMEELQRAAYEVEVYKNKIEVLISVHKECSNAWDWQDIKAADKPSKPEMSREKEQAARKNLKRYSPGVLDKILNRENKKLDALNKALEQAQEEDKRAHEEALQHYEEEVADWEKMQQIAQGVLSAQPNAYFTAIQETNPFSDIAELGSSIEFKSDAGWYIEAFIHINGEQVIPSEIKSLLQSGKLSTKKMPTSQFNMLYQDYVCSCVIRVARELFMLLPVQMVFLQAINKWLNPQTGHKEQRPILSVAIPRSTIVDLNFETIDCSDSMKNFVHRMAFNPTKGFAAIEALNPHDFSPKEIHT